VTTVVCANRAYRILQIELQRAGVVDPGRAARGHGLTFAGTVKFASERLFLAKSAPARASRS